MTRLFDPYRSVLSMAGARALFFVAFVSRIPTAAKSVTLTLHVVNDQHRGYGAAGVVGMAMTLGAAAGAPVLGRAIDRRGLRPVLLLTGGVELAYWSTAPFLPYPALLAATCVAGVLGLPVFSIVRQAVAAKVPPDQRRQAFALDSMLVELAFMVGPAAAIFAITGLGHAAPTMAAIGVLVVGSAVVIFVLDPPIGRARTPRADSTISSESSDGSGSGSTAEKTEPEKLPRGTWLRPSFVLVLASCTAASFILSGTEVSLVATLRGLDQTQWAGITIIAWCFASMIGGFWYGSTSRPLTLPTLLLLLGLGTIPVGLLGGLGWYWLCLAFVPAGFVCAPTLASATDAISRAVPPSARGQAMGLQGSAMTLGSSLGAPVAGAVIDGASPAWGFVVAGLVGASLAVLTFVTGRRDAGGAGAGSLEDSVSDGFALSSAGVAGER